MLAMRVGGGDIDINVIPYDAARQTSSMGYAFVFVRRSNRPEKKEFKWWILDYISPVLLIAKRIAMLYSNSLESPSLPLLAYVLFTGTCDSREAALVCEA